MFDAPRPAQRYGSAPANRGFGGGSFVNENPLSSSIYDDGLDPWSAAPSPSPPPVAAAPSLFGSVIADATVPPIYNQSFIAADPSEGGETSVNALSRILQTSSLPAATIDKIVNLVSSRPRVSKLEFFVALALVALAQSGKDVSIEQVAALASQNTLPEPTLNLASLQPNPSIFPQQPSNIVYQPRPAPRPAAPSYTSDDPWNTAAPPAFAGVSNPTTPATGGPSLVNGAPSSYSGTGMPKDWWKKLENINVNILGQQGFILNRYTVYELFSERGPPVQRRYSEFVFLWDCLVKRYPFRLIPALPPKRIQPDEHFLEQRRMGLKRFINFVVNHPVIKDDGILAVFLTEPSFEAWRKHASVSVEEESASKRVDRVEEMGIPSDLEEKLAIVRQKIPPLIEQWQRICILAERTIKRREAAAADLSRLTNVLKVVAEVNERCWRGDNCDLCEGVREGVGQFAVHTQAHADLLERRTRTLLYTTLESLKTQRDLYIAQRDLFIRHTRLSIDQVERLKKRVETNSSKLEGVRAGKKEGWEIEADKFAALIERDQAMIAAQLSRRVFIRACMWHELRVVLHNRENALLTQAVQAFAGEEQHFAEGVAANWASLRDSVDPMPFE